MSLSFIRTVCFQGSEILPSVVEVDIQPGLPYFTIIGLADKQIAEAKERVRLAIKNSGLPFPKGKVTVNLAPASVAKTGTSYDLAIALGLLVASKKLEPLGEGIWASGELTLEGRLLATSALLLFLVGADKHGAKGVVIPELGRKEAALVGSIPVMTGTSLRDICSKLTLKAEFKLPAHQVLIPKTSQKKYLIDGIYGQSEAKRMLEIALAGGHNLMLMGPPGCGKSRLGQAARELLPDLSRESAIEVAHMHILAYRTYDLDSRRPPFVEVHHGVSVGSLLGGGSPVVPGEFSLAHKGVLFLDEFAEMSRPVREALREPMEKGEIRLHKNNTPYSYPGMAIIIAATNSCRCGMKREGICICTATELSTYRKRVSGAIEDRFDMFCAMPKITPTEWGKKYRQGEGMADNIRVCRERQYARHRAEITNGMIKDLGDKSLELLPTVRAFLERSAEKLSLTARGMQRTVMVARTIADLAGVGGIDLKHVQEALHYRQRSFF